MTIQHKALLTALAVVALLTGWPLWANASFYFFDPALQILDFASDDMLVVEAKKLSLLHGHYSRAGFYHPGPFYFYWMAGWEFLLHDHLSLFASVVAAQHFAATLLMALAFGSFTFLTTTLSGNRLTGLAATAAMFALVYWTTGNVITAPWPPHMLVASSLFTVTAATGVLLMGWGWLPLLCFGALQMLHGHAMFFGLLPLIALPCVLIAVKRHGFPSLRTPSLWIAAAITAVMLAPLMVITLFNFPEPWAAYLRQARTGQHVAAVQALSLLGGFLLPLLAGIPLLFASLLPRLSTPSDDARTASVRFVACVIFSSGFAAAAWFALRGVDSIDNRYLLFWFAPFAALPGAMAVVALAIRLPRIAGGLLCIVVVIATVFVCRNMLPWMLFNAKQYSQYQAIWKQLQQLAHSSHLQLHTDNHNRYADIWSQTLTFAALSNRAATPVLCIAEESWLLSYHAELRCRTPGDANTVHILVSAEPTGGTSQQAGDLPFGEINGIFYRRISIGVEPTE